MSHLEPERQRALGVRGLASAAISLRSGGISNDGNALVVPTSVDWTTDTKHILRSLMRRKRSVIRTPELRRVVWNISVVPNRLEHEWDTEGRHWDGVRRRVWGPYTWASIEIEEWTGVSWRALRTTISSIHLGEGLECGFYNVKSDALNLAKNSRSEEFRFEHGVAGLWIIDQSFDHPGATSRKVVHIFASSVN